MGATGIGEQSNNETTAVSSEEQTTSALDVDQRNKDNAMTASDPPPSRDDLVQAPKQETSWRSPDICHRTEHPHPPPLCPLAAC